MNWFKRIATAGYPKNVEVVDRQPLSVAPMKSTKDIIEEIHDTFYTEVDRLLKDAGIKGAEPTLSNDALRGKKLVELGFVNSKQAQQFNNENKRVEEVQQTNTQKAQLKRAIEYFSFKYPNYKFITEESVKKICEKYNLIYGEVTYFKGEVPTKNLQHIIDFKIDENDEAWAIIKPSPFFGNTVIGLAGKTEAEWHENTVRVYRTLKLPLEICAPLKDFDTTNMKIENFKLSKIEIPDPVVLQPILFEGVKHYLIVTAWGDEASDELVVNQKMN